MNDRADSLTQWLPVIARAADGRLELELARLGALRFTEPFFNDSLSPLMTQPVHAVFRRRVDADAAARWLADNPPLPMAGFVFHVSRCGSTLASQWLAASPRHRVLSEPAPLDAALRGGGPSIPEATRIAWLHATLGLLGQRGDTREQRVFVKFDCWHALHLPLLRKAFPDVPWIFMTRDPVEVIVSHLRMPGAQMVPGMLGLTAPGVDPLTAWQVPREEYVARMLGGICEAAASALDAQAQVVDYTELPAALEAVVAPHFGVQPGTDEALAMTQALDRDAKNPHQPFSPDQADKQAQATSAVRAAAAQWVAPALERLRLQAQRAASPL